MSAVALGYRLDNPCSMPAAIGACAGRKQGHVLVMKSEKIIEHLNLAVLMVDEALRIRYLNPAGEECLGTGIRYARGRPLTDFIFDTGDAFISHIRRSIDTGDPVAKREVCIKRVGASEITINCVVTPIPTGGETECLLEITRIDHLIRISHEEHLLTENLATRNMLRGLAHEIRNPLGGLRGAAQLLAGELAGEELRSYTDVIIGEADRLSKLVDCMFGPGVSPQKQELNIHNVLEHVRHLAVAEVPESVNFSTDYDPSIPALHADRDLLVQAMLNLVGNAVRAVGTQGDVCLKTRVLRRHMIGDTCHRLVILISVLDNGCGIAEELKPQIFFPMVSGNAEGTGLGLSIAQSLVHLHGGLIEFDSVPGQTEFRVLLPLNGVAH